MNPAHRQRDHAVRLEWGPVGAAALAPVDIAVVVDVLSFTTTLTVAVERGIEVIPFRWHDERAARVAAERDAVLAIGRPEAGP
ncbi:MAG: 2-phosphosulfolactate phosphatase, partial [Nocardioides sp.]